jgi:allophanate hydrolase subunit 2
VFKGPEFEMLPLEMQKELFKSPFKINPQSNRMACLLDSQTIFSAQEIITSAVQPGTVQLTPSGKIIVLMRDAQTTGGYARIFQLTEMAINILAQKPAGSKVMFKLAL